MGRARLLRSILVMTLLYGGAMLLWFALMPPTQVKRYVEALPGWMRVESLPDSLSVFTASQWQLDLLIMWSLPVFLAWCLAILGGLGLAWCLVNLFKIKLRRRSGAGLVFAGCQSTVGDLLTPSLPNPIDDVNVRIQGIDFDNSEQALADQAMGLIHNANKPYAGDGHGVSLYQHTLNLLSRVADDRDADTDLALAAIAHDMGKIVAYVQVGKTWQVATDHGLASGRLLRLLPAFEAIDANQAEALHAAVRYSHAPDSMPTNMHNPERAQQLMAGLKRLDGETTAQEKQAVLDSHDVAAEVMDLFWANLGRMPFYRANRERQGQTVGWRKGRRLYLNEHALREWLQTRMKRDLAAALGRIRRSRQIHAMTQTMLTEFDRQGYLVTEARIGETIVSLPAEASLWSVQSGQRPFNGVFILEIPDDGQVVLPQPPPFAIYPLGPATNEIEALSEVREADSNEVISPAREPTKAETGQDKQAHKKNSGKGGKSSSSKGKQGAGGGKKPRADQTDQSDNGSRKDTGGAEIKGKPNKPNKGKSNKGNKQTQSAGRDGDGQNAIDLDAVLGGQQQTQASTHANEPEQGANETKGQARTRARIENRRARRGASAASDNSDPWDDYAVGEGADQSPSSDADGQTEQPPASGGASDEKVSSHGKPDDRQTGDEADPDPPEGAEPAGKGELTDTTNANEDGANPASSGVSAPESDPAENTDTNATPAPTRQSEETSEQAKSELGLQVDEDLFG